MKRNIEDILNTISLRDMSESEKDVLWSRIETGLLEKPKAASLWVLLHTRSFLKKLLAVTLIFGTTATTAFAANSARPGDLLFPVDQAIEKIQLTFATSQDKREELKLKFALERVEEVRQILEEVAQLEHLLSPNSEDIQYQVLVEEAQEAELVAEAAPTSVPVVEGPSPEEATSKPILESPEDNAALEAPVEALEEIAADTEEESEDPLVESLESPVEASDDAVITSIEVEKPDPISAKSKERIELALGTTLEYLGQIQTDLTLEEGNEENLKKIDALFNDIQEQIDSLPEDMTFTITVKTKEKVEFDITVENGAEVIEATVSEEDVEASEPEENTKPSDAVPKDEEPIEPADIETEDAEEDSDEEESLRKEDEETAEGKSVEEVDSDETEDPPAGEEPNVTTTIEIDAGEHIGTIQIDIDGDLSSLLEKEVEEEGTENL